MYSFLFCVFAFTSQAQVQILPSSNYANLTPATGNTFYFTATTAGNEHALWKSDGTANGTVLVKTIGAANLTYVNGTLYFITNYK
ncbi:hypothetical protein GXP67_30880 [Rhodocytophaga rosea]|uniref:DUF5050 domain-containing protein n=2 Tax=Rhodocytophaga rosea TaxID=2704465 RepID=A0A6C0GW45_9BACT|nr:hypothetical protein GXP67_30880 [Rhodocytophaga rosea]